MAGLNTDDTYSSSVSKQSNYVLPPLLPATDLFANGGLDLSWTGHDPQTTTTTSSTDDPFSALPTPLQLDGNNCASPSSASSSSSTDDDSGSVSPLLWVPADRHPEIAPSEFTKWLETNGSNTRKATAALRRKSSVLSQLHIPSDQQQPQQQSSTFAATDELKEISFEFDRHSPAQDTSRVLAPRGGNGSLLRRSAFSARGRGRKLTSSRHGTINSSSNSSGDGTQQADIIQRQRQQEPSSSPPSPSPSATKKEPVRLYDRPVSMSEWIDLGSASLLDVSDDSQQGILSRVHDAESHLLSQLTISSPPPTKSNHSSKEEDRSTEGSSPSPTHLGATFDPQQQQQQQQQQQSPSIPLSEKTTITDHGETRQQRQPDSAARQPPSTPIPTRPVQRASSERLPTSKQDKKLSWFGGFFGGGEKEKKRGGSLRRVDDERHAQEKQQQQQKIDHSNSFRKSGLGSLFSRSKSISTATTTTTSKHPLRQDTPLPATLLPKLGLANDRLPLHVERALYRLSHYKLADPRRPLQHQVAISNLMFWYLSVINAHPPPTTLMASPSNHHAHFDEPAARPPTRDDDDLPLSHYKGET